MKEFYGRNNMKVLDLFSGIGGFSLGLERAGMETVAFCEYDEKCRLVLNKHWPKIPIFNDIRKLNYENFRAEFLHGFGEPDIDVICGGFPCQPWSHAGKRKGNEDNRDLWPEMLRVIREFNPRWVIGENVEGFTHQEMGLGRTISDLENEGYKTRVFNIPACAVGAPHQRKRIWIIANSISADSGGRSTTGNTGHEGRETRPAWGEGVQPENGEACSDNIKQGREDVAYANGSGRGEQWGAVPIQEEQFAIKCDGKSGIPDAHSRGQSLRGDRGVSTTSQIESSGAYIRGRKEKYEPGQRWKAEPNVGRVVNGVPGRVDRLKQLGNAVVPQIVEQIGRAIILTEIDYEIWGSY